MVVKFFNFYFDLGSPFFFYTGNIRRVFVRVTYPKRRKKFAPQHCSYFWLILISTHALPLSTLLNSPIPATHHLVTAVSNNTQPARQNVSGFWVFLRRQSNRYRSIHSCLWSNEQKLQTVNVDGNIPIPFHPPISVFLLDLEGTI